MDIEFTLERCEGDRKIATVAYAGNPVEEESEDDYAMRIVRSFASDLQMQTDENGRNVLTLTMRR